MLITRGQFKDLVEKTLTYIEEEKITKLIKKILHQ